MGWEVGTSAFRSEQLLIVTCPRRGAAAMNEFIFYRVMLSLHITYHSPLLWIFSHVVQEDSRRQRLSSRFLPEPLPLTRGQRHYSGLEPLQESGAVVAASLQSCQVFLLNQRLPLCFIFPLYFRKFSPSLSFPA